MNKAGVEILYLKDYAHFLFQNHLTDLAKQELVIKRELEQPLLKWLNHLTDEEFLKIIEKRLTVFLRHMMEGRGNEDIERGISDWKSDQLQELSRLQVTAMDIAVDYGARKKALLKFLPYYTHDLDLALKIINEIVDFYTVHEKRAIEAYTDIQKEESERIIKSQKETEQKLLVKEKRLEESQRMAELGNWEFDLSTGVYSWSDELFRMFGLSYKSSMGLDDIFPLMTKEASERIQENIHNALEFGTSYTHEYEIIRPDGQHRIVRTYAVPEKDKDGKVKLLKGITQDITHLRETEGLLRQSQELLEQIAKLAPIIILVIRVEDNELIYYNENIFENLAIKEVDVKKNGYNHLLEIIHPDDLKTVINRSKSYRSIKENEESIMEFRIKDKAGNWRWYYSRSIVFKRNGNGEVTQILFTASDINDLKSAEETLKQNANFIQKVAETIPNILYIYDIREQKNVYANRTVGDVLGYSPEGLKDLGTNVLTTFLHPDDLPKITRYFNDFVNAKEGEIRKLVYRMKDARGKWSWFISMDTIFARDEKGMPFQILGVTQDITDRVEAEEALKYSEAQLVEAQKIGHVGSFDWNMKTNIVQGTQEFFKIFGLNGNNGTVRLEEIQDLIPEDDARKMFKLVEEAVLDNKMIDVDFRINVGEKTQNLISRAKIYKDESGQGARVVGSILDITEIKRTEETLKIKNDELTNAYDKLDKAQSKLRSINTELEKRVKERTAELEESEEKYRAFVAQSQEGIWRFELHIINDIDVALSSEEQVQKILDYGYVAECNERMAHMYGYASSSKLTGRTIKELFDTNDEKIVKIFRRFVDSGYKLENLLTYGSGPNESKKYYSSNVLGIVAKGKLVRAWSTQIDITAAKVAEREMKASEEQYRFLAETVPQLFWASDANGCIEYYNQNWYNYTGLEFDKDQKWSWINAVYDKDKGPSISKLNECVKSGEMFEIECRLRKHNGNFEWHLARALPLKGDGEIKKWFGTFTDINERKLIEENLRIKNEELSKINLDLDNFIYTASHDLKAPISNIEGLLLTINDTLDPEHCKDEEIVQLFEMMDKSILRFKRTIHDLTEITRAQKSAEEDKEYVVFERIFEDVVTSIYDLVNATQATFDLDFSVPSIKFSRKSMRSIFYNLISNALKYRHPDRKPVVEVKTEQEEDWTVLTVKDNGLGISDTNKEKVFSMFKRLHAHEEGSGVGLYIVKRIVTNAGGKIELESKVDEGTTFKVFLK
ncbi:phytochrome-like protein cph1 [Sporocytophaga myxococcoides]|uniref:histidine kinase n=1 Tax=Sporocytophaga myxococcoides TaxID=153721 RepID=A0A098LE65_9BACT|nr:PAS domain-containing sensor histidine kinase [Sporocytophaga myxococcoides]GAL84503.1 phytochrome-like protein cph1 [Sporocytophaga myxococcoides]